jgi:hypothetical protein
MTRINAFRFFVVPAALAAATATAPAFVGDEEDRAVSKTIVINSDEPMSVSKTHSFVVKVEDGEVTVTVDGEDLPSNRFHTDDGRIIILDEDGNEVKSFDVMLGHGGDEMHLQWLGDKPFVELEDLHLEHAPNVMIGVHLDEPMEALQYHLRLEPGETTMISGLYKGLPAHQAGLERFDIIVAVDGIRPANPKSIIDALADREPGDEVTFSVIQKGRTKEFSVTLEPFDRARMKREALIGGNSFSHRILIPGEGDIKFFPGLPPGDWQKILIDPESGEKFQWRNEFKFPDDFHKEFNKELGQRIPRDLDERMESLNVRIEELQEMIARLVEQAQELAEEAE